MMLRVLAVATVALSGLPAETRAAPAGNLRELAEQLAHCLEMPGDGNLTVFLTLGRDGRLLGTPHIEYDKLGVGAKQERRASENVAASLERCTPAAITQALGKTIAGKSLKLRFRGNRRELEI
jgi:hypothetical protein